MAEGVHKITEQFEQEIARYTGAPFCVAVDNCSNALFLALKYDGIEGKEITIPARTYPSVPCEIIHAGGKVRFDQAGQSIKGAYRLKPSRVSGLSPRRVFRRRRFGVGQGRRQPFFARADCRRQRHAHRRTAEIHRRRRPHSGRLQRISVDGEAGAFARAGGQLHKTDDDAHV